VNSDNRLDWVTAWRQRLIRERAKHREAIAAIDQRLSVIDDYEVSLRRLRGIATPTSTTIEIEHINGCPACELDGIISDQGGSLSEVCTGDASAAEA
jgi:hypothetical protein